MGKKWRKVWRFCLFWTCVGSGLSVKKLLHMCLLLWRRKSCDAGSLSMLDIIDWFCSFNWRVLDYSIAFAFECPLHTSYVIGLCLVFCYMLLIKFIFAYM